MNEVDVLILQLSDTKEFKDLLIANKTGKNKKIALDNFNKLLKEFANKHNNKG